MAVPASSIVNAIKAGLELFSGTMTMAWSSGAYIQASNAVYDYIIQHPGITSTEAYATLREQWLHTLGAVFGDPDATYNADTNAGTWNLQKLDTSGAWDGKTVDEMYTEAQQQPDLQTMGLLTADQISAFAASGGVTPFLGTLQTINGQLYNVDPSTGLGTYAGGTLGASQYLSANGFTGTQYTLPSNPYVAPTGTGGTTTPPTYGGTGGTSLTTSPTSYTSTPGGQGLQTIQTTDVGLAKQLAAASKQAALQVAGIQAQQILNQTEGQARVSDYNAGIYRQNALNLDQAGTLQLQQLSTQQNRTIGSIAQSYNASGFSLSGSGLDVMRDASRQSYMQMRSAQMDIRNAVVQQNQQAQVTDYTSSILRQSGQIQADNLLKIADIQTHSYLL